jgi:acid phosphatase (class A)
MENNDMRTVPVLLPITRLLLLALPVCCVEFACAAEPVITQTPATAVYLEPDAVDLISLLAPPPAAESAAQARDLAALHAAQESRSNADIVRVQTDMVVNISVFAAVLGPAFNEDKLPLLKQFFRNVSRSTATFIGMTKDCWNRPRPFASDPTIIPPPKLKESIVISIQSPAAKSSNPLCTPATVAPHYSPSYPSGHATFGAMTAIQLADMLPERRQAIFERGWEYGYSRELGGVHYPSDIEAGRIQATVLVVLMQKNQNYQHDFAAARQELRQLLGYDH